MKKNKKMLLALLTLTMLAISFVGCQTTSSNDEDNPTLSIDLSSPSNQAISQDTALDLTWSGNADSYDLYFGTSLDTLSKIAPDLKNTSYNKSELDYQTTYYWAVWSFTTKIKPLSIDLSAPSNQAISQDTALDLAWSGNADSYDLYFGTSQDNLSKIAPDLTNKNYNKTGLDYQTTYYWQVVAKKSDYADVSSPVWSFATDQKPITREKLVNMIANKEDVADVNVSSITDMSYLMDSVASVLGEDIWDCSTVHLFNDDISKWRVKNVTDMSFMFFYATAFNGDISEWFVGNVTDMSYMFRRARAFKSDISKWRVDNVENMESMFNGAQAFKSDISNWRVDNVENMRFMFSYADAFNGDISKWFVGNVTDMGYMFRGALAFNGDISKWIVDNVTDMDFMFCEATAFNCDISKWNVSNVTNMNSMFYGAKAFNSDISKWFVSNVTDMGLMFCYAEAFKSDISEWIVGNVTDMGEMFWGATAFKSDISGWLVGNVTDHSDFDKDSSPDWGPEKKPKF